MILILRIVVLKIRNRFNPVREVWFNFYCSALRNRSATLCFKAHLRDLKSFCFVWWNIQRFVTTFLIQNDLFILHLHPQGLANAKKTLHFPGTNFEAWSLPLLTLHSAPLQSCVRSQNSLLCWQTYFLITVLINFRNNFAFKMVLATNLHIFLLFIQDLNIVKFG